MMDSLKLRFKLNTLEFEIEGNHEIVKEEFGQFKEFLATKLLPISGFLSTENLDDENPQQSEKPSETIRKLGSASDFPILKEIVIRDLPNSEYEWIVIYAFYASYYGKDPFSDKAVMDLFEASGRKTKARMKHYRANFDKAVDQGLFRVLNDEEYILKPEGIEFARQILQQESSTSKNNLSAVKTKKSKSKKPDEKIQEEKVTPKKRSRLGGEALRKDNNLNLFGGSGIESYKEFLEKKSPGNKPEFIAVTVYYLQEVLKLEPVTLNQIYTCFYEAKVEPTNHFRQTLTNVKNSEGFIEFDEGGNILLSTRGRHHVDFKLPKSKKDK